MDCHVALRAPRNDIRQKRHCEAEGRGNLRFYIEIPLKNHYNNKDRIINFLLGGETSVLKKSGYLWF